MEHPPLRQPNSSAGDSRYGVSPKTLAICSSRVLIAAKVLRFDCDQRRRQEAEGVLQAPLCELFGHPTRKTTHVSPDSL